MKNVTLKVTTKIDGKTEEHSGAWSYPQTIEEARKVWGDKNFLTFALRYAKILREGELRTELRKMLAGEGESASGSPFDIEVE